MVAIDLTGVTRWCLSSAMVTDGTFELRCCVHYALCIQLVTGCRVHYLLLIAVCIMQCALFSVERLNETYQ